MKKRGHPVLGWGVCVCVTSKNRLHFGGDLAQITLGLGLQLPRRRVALSSSLLDYVEMCEVNEYIVKIVTL